MSDFKEVTIGSTTYRLKYFPALEGWDLQARVYDCEKDQRLPSSSLIFDVISKGVSIGASSIDEKKFNKHFAGKYSEILELFQEVCLFNFGGGDKEDPNEESASTED